MSFTAETIETILRHWVVKLTGSGQFIIDRCPYCDAREHLYCSSSTGKWICFRCNESGDLAKLYAELEDISYTEALIEIREQGLSGIEWKEIVIDDSEPVVVDLPEEFVPCFEEGHWRIPVYLKERGVDKRTIKEWGIGYCERGKYRDRIVIPISTGEESTFVARAAMSGMYPPYLGPEVDEGRGRRFLAGFQFVKEGSEIVICEGPFDALRIWKAGLKPLGLLGKGFGIRQKKLLIDLSPSQVVVMLDPDAWKEEREIVEELQSFLRNVRAAHLEGDRDPGDLDVEDVRNVVACASTIERVDRSRMLSKLVDPTY